MTDNRKISLAWVATLVAAAVIILDQILKMWVKTHFYLGESVEILPFFELKFIQNNGMAFGMELGSKLFLTLFRIVVVGFLLWYIIRLCKAKNTATGYIVTLSLIAAGAAGNIIDCVLYGLIFTNPMPFNVAEFVPIGEGYGTIFHGLVVDMLYFPLFSVDLPQWLPLVGGETFSFFDPVFNLADSAITVGIFMLLIFYSKYLPVGNDEKKEE